MGWWSAKCNDFTKRLIGAGRARQHKQQCKSNYNLIMMLKIELKEINMASGILDDIKGFY
jgi:hypothetical protein